MMQNQKRERIEISPSSVWCALGEEALLFISSSCLISIQIHILSSVGVCIDYHHQHHHMCTWHGQLTQKNSHATPFIDIRIPFHFSWCFTFTAKTAHFLRRFIRYVNVVRLLLMFICCYIVNNRDSFYSFVLFHRSMLNRSNVPSVLLHLQLLFHLPAAHPFIRFHIGISPFDYYRFSEYCRVVPFYFLFVIW